MSAVKEIKVPDIGDFKNIPVIEILVKPGDVVAAEDTLITLESDKATLEIPAPSAGTVRTVSVSLGDRVSEGSVVLLLEAANDDTAPPPSANGVHAPSSIPVSVAAPISAPPPVLSLVPPVAAPASAPFIAAGPTREPHASPSLRRFAREFGVDLGQVVPSGPKGRIVREDIQGFVKARLARPAAPGGASEIGSGLNLLPWPQIDFAKFGPIERAPLSKIKKISGANLARNSIVIPHVTNFDEADVTELEAFRVGVNKDSGAKITTLAFLIKALVVALKKFPHFNASLDGDELILKGYYHIGFAADTPNGLVVPVIRDADRKGILEIAAEAAQLSALARDGKLKPTDMQGGCITVSSLGGIGGTGFTPIINAPEVAILGAARAQTKPVWDGKQFQPRLIMPTSLSWDHRVVDGAAAARFLVALSALLADFRRISL